MKERTNSARVVIYGEPYLLKGEASNSHLHQVAEWVDQKMKEIAKRNPKLDHTRIAVLAAVNIADELLRVRRELEELYQMIDEEKGEV
ncbi:conserved hypothetical protein [[Clostridium] ultunense Esp]|uniref:cell division protein ZapA n=1 Tax=Thermicanus aegyptius TaxID=94009 RepID=UPI0002B6F1D0|nr:cell division protein ZapA [Thermicanus aegyptius]CCQ98344.1 conserved hypothetical protein [[Clostridium] ultunense Esp]